ncbi:MAG: phenylalanine--tRNA ligase subunit beta [Clostridiales bacterium]|nr:phenylalanine--tRNA ligase subunit beta [Clostridiales bacterium]
MKVSYSWIKEYTKIDAGIKEFCDAMTMSGSKVEGWQILGDDIKNVVSGKVVEITKHPDADKLVVTQIDIGSETIQVVTGAKNLKEGDFVPVALHGSSLPGGLKIKKGKLRGVVSEGMLCSIAELNVTINDYPNAIEDGIMVLDGGVELGRDITKVLGLDEEIIEFEITSNRPDCFSVIGLAREAAATFKKDFTVKEPNLKEEAEGNISEMISIEVKDSELCPRYTARVITDVVIEPSPEWLRQHLRDAGVRPINNIVDITNYVMLEYGQPMHAFDLANIAGKKIIVRSAEEGEILETLDDQPRKLDSSMLVIADAEKPVAVAGVMGGAASEVTDSTKTILFESATFKATNVRLTAQKLVMRTESSGRFEKGLDLNNTLPAINRACELVEELGAGKVIKGVVDVCAEVPAAKTIQLRVDRINAFLGTYISRNEMLDIFTPLEIKVDGNVVTAPSFRPDLLCEADLAEEVARFYGYNNIKATMLAGEETIQGKRSYKQRLRDIVEGVCLASGMYEIYTYSFTSPGVFDRLGLAADDDLRKTVKIRNPLGEDYSVMRTTTFPEMMKVIAHNCNRNIEKGAFYEMAFTYHPVDGSNRPDEKTILTLGMYNSGGFFDMKGVIEEITDTLGISDIEYEPVSDNPIFHSGRCASLIKGGVSIGLLGQVNPSICKEFEVPEETILGTLDVNRLYELSDFDRKYTELPKYPAVTRDIAILVDDDVTSGSIIQLIKDSAGAYLEKVNFFDVYKGEQTGESKKSLAFSMVYRSSEKTLTEEEVSASFNKVVRTLGEKIGAELR